MTQPSSADAQEAPRPIERFRKFIKIFEDCSRSSDAAARAASALLPLIGDEKNGLIAAIDDLSEEIAGLREDLRAFAKAMGVHVGVGGVLGSMFGKRTR